MSILYRRWVDLRLWRLCVGLAVAPLPVAFVILAGVSAVEQGSMERLFWYARVILECSMMWSVVVGLAYIVAVTPWRMKLSRAECVILGGVTGVLFPYAIISVRHFAPLGVLQLLDLHPHIKPLSTEFFDWTSPADYFIPALFLAFGLFGGWVFWGVGVRPARLPPPDLSTFD